MTPQISLYDTATRKQQPFTTLHPGVVNMYCCGPTVYHFAHIGNLRTFVFEDLLRRVLDYHGYTVNHIVNITDVGHLTSDADTGEDKMEKGAAREGKTVWEIADFYTQAFLKDWKRLGLKEPSRWTKATDHIPEQIALVKVLEEKGYAYVIPGDGVYFDTARFPRYADFAGLDVRGLQEGARIGVTEGKRNPTDFALWKISPTDVRRAMEWDAPWGRGFPGWHVECSAMAMKHLGPTLDIHCGGSDLIRVHHTNEIAQSEGATGVTFSRFWLHGGWLLEAPAEDGSGGGKMSKSAGEFVTLDFLVKKGYGAMDYRYMCLGAHYRGYLNFSWEGLETARDSLRSLRRRTDPLIGRASAIASDNALGWQRRFLEAVYDDLGFPQGLAVLNQMLKDPDLLEGEKAALVRDFDRLLGLGLENREARAETALPGPLSALLEERKDARRNKDWKRSDEIRDLLKGKGFGVKDNPDGTTSWFPL
ncbi:MAG TPA: cysteine--tRNA ligase [Fibrobacteria bacterium]|nr:cysteine--tRNA ligase [Fibrobacteria bacterium]